MHSIRPLIESLIALSLVGGFFALVHALTSGRGMGIGDAYIGGIIGFFLGIEGGIIAAALGVWIGAILGICVMLLNKVFPSVRFQLMGHRVTLKAELPFVPFLALGAVVVFCLPGIRETFGFTGLTLWLVDSHSWSYWSW